MSIWFLNKRNDTYLVLTVYYDYGMCVVKYQIFHVSTYNKVRRSFRPPIQQ